MDTPIWLERTELLIGKESIDLLKNLNVLIVGLGGVGSFAAEFLARAGVGKMTIVDGDIIDITNINRQLPALHSTVKISKAELMQKRILDINPTIELRTINQFLNPEDTIELVHSEDYQYVLDCIDSVTPKLNLIIACKRKKVKIISSMGAGGKMEASKVQVSDISKTVNCFLAKAIKKRLKEVKIDKGIKVVFSSEIQYQSSLKTTDGSNYKKSFYGTNSYMPGLFGLYAAETVIRNLLKKE
jgi:tRNA A37 threonylcarbamoyladenosine dehydratase